MRWDGYNFVSHEYQKLTMKLLLQLSTVVAIVNAVEIINHCFNVKITASCSFIVPAFEENGILMLGVVVFIRSIFTGRKNNFQQNLIVPHSR